VQKPALEQALKLRGGLDLETSSLIGAIYNGGFGVTLMANPDMFYGPNGFLPYFSTEIGVVGQTFFGRAFGAMLTAIAAMHFLDGPTTALCKQMAISAILVLWPMALALQDSDNFPASTFAGSRSGCCVDRSQWSIADSFSSVCISPSCDVPGQFGSHRLWCTSPSSTSSARQAACSREPARPPGI
jgi:hypothetical protein